MNRNSEIPQFGFRKNNEIHKPPNFEPPGPGGFRRNTENRQSFAKYTPVYPKKHYWCGFNEKGTPKWYIELSNGRIVSERDENYFFWLKKYNLNEKKTSYSNFSNRKESFSNTTDDANR